jgi:hypothetical protein
VWIFPYTVLTNDPHPPSEEIIGPKVGEFTQIAVNSVILPGVEIGKNCLIGANSLVSKNFEDYSLVVGSPAKYIKDIREVKNKVGETLYQPVLTENGSIIGVELPGFPVPIVGGVVQAPPTGESGQTTQSGISGETFKSVPSVLINTRTGEGAVIYPVLQFVPQFINDNPDLNVGIGSIVNVVDCV